MPRTLRAGRADGGRHVAVARRMPRALRVRGSFSSPPGESFYAVSSSAFWRRPRPASSSRCQGRGRCRPSGSSSRRPPGSGRPGGVRCVMRALRSLPSMCFRSASTSCVVCRSCEGLPRLGIFGHHFPCGFVRLHGDGLITAAGADPFKVHPEISPDSRPLGDVS